MDLDGTLTLKTVTGPEGLFEIEVLAEEPDAEIGVIIEQPGKGLLVRRTFTGPDVDRMRDALNFVIIAAAAIGRGEARKLRQYGWR